GLRSRFFRQIVQILRRQPDGWQGEDVQYDGTKIKQDAHSYLCGVALTFVFVIVNIFTEVNSKNVYLV
ncbi:MAG: hypothetical protein IJK23_08700, partial [Clostridia bacterium]|nr:hypothetical protein [Clostridia bacterium]